MSRTVTIISLAQALVALICFLVLLGTFKLYGYPDTFAVRWNPLAVFLREHGAWFLLLPVFWVGYACHAQRVDAGWLSFRIAIVVGIIVICITLGLFLYSIEHPYTRPFLFCQ
jgi:hypothetical protein